MRERVLTVCALLALLAAPAAAQQKDQEARAAYLEGKAAYEARRFDVALERFKRSYVLSSQPALLYNIASTLQQLDKPGQAAQALRDFLVRRPDDPERPEVEARIANLEEAQRLIDRDEVEKAKMIERQRRERDRADALVAVPGWLSEAEADRRLALVRQREHKRRRALGLGLGLGLGLLVAGAVTVGVVCGTGHCGSSTHDFDFAPVTVTR